MTLSLEKIAHQLFYVFGLLTLLASVFNTDVMIFLKPVVIVTLSFLYISKAKNVNYLVLLTMGVIMVTEILSFKEFTLYFSQINILLSVYYILNIVLLGKSLLKVKIKLKKVFTVQMVITMSLIIYVLYTVTILILPAVHSQRYLIILVICFILFLSCCYYIYLNSKTVVSSSLMVAASCFLIVNILTALNELYVSLEVFPVIMNLLQISGQFFLIRFFIEQDDLVPYIEEYF